MSLLLEHPGIRPVPCRWRTSLQQRREKSTSIGTTQENDQRIHDPRRGRLLNFVDLDNPAVLYIINQYNQSQIVYTHNSWFIV